MLFLLTYWIQLKAAGTKTSGALTVTAARLQYRQPYEAGVHYGRRHFGHKITHTERRTTGHSRAFPFEEEHPTLATRGGGSS